MSQIPNPNAQYPRSNTRRPTAQTLWLAMIAVSVLLLAFLAIAWRLDQAPDIFTDEILYTRAGIRVAAEGALVWDNAEPLFVHPPLYFLVLGAYLGLTDDPASAALAPGDIFAWVYHARYLNALLAGLTALLLFELGRRLRGPGLGLLLAALFFLDPFGVRINRRAMLETMAVLFSLAGMALLLTGRERSGPVRSLVAGLLLGAGLLSKELTFTAPLAVLLFGLWESWRRRRRPAGSAFLAVAIAGLTYSLFPLWALTTGRWDRFAHVKWLSLQRLLGLVQLSGWNRPGVSLWDFLLNRLTDYGSSYLLLALGGLAALWLLVAQRRTASGAHRRENHPARLLAAWGAVLYPLYAFVTLAGSGNDQFFYFLLIPALLLVGYTTASLLPPLSTLHPSSAILLTLLLSYNAARWWTTYGAGQDNGYRQLAAYVGKHLPPGEPLNASGDAIKFEYFFPDRPITDAATPAEAQAMGVRYFALAPKDVQARYGRTTPELAAWLQTEGKFLFVVDGDSYGPIYLYRMGDPEASLTAPSGPTTPPAGRSFPPAQTGFVSSLLLMLGMWCAIVGGLGAFLAGRRRLRRRSSSRRAGRAKVSRVYREPGPVVPAPWGAAPGAPLARRTTVGGRT